MSGGFFRGTSTDQDTRFSIKQAKLLKSKKFAPELEHLVDMTKVKMDPMKPWIATRVTELLGFEDEVLINFIFVLLDGKEVNGKEVQISLTGFMEKNTGKFMKELWALLLSAQLNASGVPQQFLDAKEEETRKKKVEADRITDEIRKKREKESRDMGQGRVIEMDDRLEKITSETRKLSPWASNSHPFEISNSSKRNGVRGAASERPRSRSLSKSPRSQCRSVSSEKSPRRHSPTTRWRYSPHRLRSPARHSSLYYRRSRSPIRHRSPSPARRRLQSPRRKSRSPRHRRSLTPIWRHRALSPVRRRRTPSPSRRRRTPSPVRGRTPSPVHKRKRSSAARQRSPFEFQLSPARRRSPSSVQRRSPSPIHTRALSPVQGRSLSPLYRKSLSPVLSGSPSPLQQRSLSSLRRESSSISRRKKKSPSTSSEKSPLAAQRRSARSAGRSPLHVRGRSMTPSEKSFSLKSSSPSPAGRSSLSPSPRRSFRKRSPAASSKVKPRERPISPYKNPKKLVRSPTEDKRTTLPNESPVRHVKDRVRHDDSPSAEKQGDVRLCHDGREREENTRPVGTISAMTRDKRSENLSALGKHRNSQQKMDNQVAFPLSKAIGDRSTGSKGHLDGMEFRNKDQRRMREKSSVPGAHSGSVDRVTSQKIDEDSGMKKQKSDPAGIEKSNEKSLQLSNSAKDDNQLRSKVVEELADLSSAVFDGGDTNVNGRKEKRSNKRSKRRDTESDDESYDCEAEERKEAKRRRRAEKKLRKEERRRRREEHHHKREERRAEKHKLRKTSASSPSDSGQDQGDTDASDSPHANRKEIHSGKVEADPKQKKLGIELQLKALESFKAKKGIGC